MSSVNGTNGTDRSNSEAQERQEQLSKKLHIDTYARYPRELIEFLMDRPPKDALQRQGWKSLKLNKERVYACYLRYSWCWPICLEYAAVTDDRDEIRRDHMDRPLILSFQAVAGILGLSEQRVADAVLTLVDEKLIRVESRQRGGVSAVYPEPRPAFTKEERRDRGTPVSPVENSVHIEADQERRFLNLFNKLGPENTIIFPLIDGVPREMTVRDYRTHVWTHLIEARTLFRNAWKEARVQERKAYSDLATAVSHLIEVSQSPDIRIPSSSSGATMDLARGVGAGNESVGSGSSSYTGPISPTTTPESQSESESQGPEPDAASSVGVGKQGSFFEGLNRIFESNGKGSLTPRQLAECWREMPDDAEFEDLDAFLTKPQGPQAKIHRAKNAGIALTLVQEFKRQWARGAPDRARYAAAQAKSAAGPGDSFCPMCNNSGFVDGAIGADGAGLTLAEARELAAAGRQVCIFCQIGKEWRKLLQ